MVPARSGIPGHGGTLFGQSLAPTKSRQGEFQQCNEEMIALAGTFWMAGTLGIPGCAVWGGVYPPCILHIANKNQSKSLLWKILPEEIGLS